MNTLNSNQCSISAELGNLSKVGQVGAGVTPANDQQGNGNRRKKELLSERFDK